MVIQHGFQWHFIRSAGGKVFRVVFNPVLTRGEWIIQLPDMFCVRADPVPTDKAEIVAIQAVSRQWSSAVSKSSNVISFTRGFQTLSLPPLL